MGQPDTVCLLEVPLGDRLTQLRVKLIPDLTMLKFF